MLYPVMFFLKKKASEGKLSSKTIETGFRREVDKDLLGHLYFVALEIIITEPR